MMDIVEFVERVCNFPLLDHQKEFVRKVYDAAKNEKHLYYIPPRGSNRFSFELLQAIVLITIAQERGLLNKEFIDNYSVEKTFPEPFSYVGEKKEERKKYDPYKYAREFSNFVDKELSND